ncbi:MAG: hypothetical protein P1U48_14410 [Pseudooceanicola sp.]|nr:hypothetical protein [Pseudooceanicola sp.]
MALEQVTCPAPAPGEALVCNTAIGAVLPLAEAAAAHRLLEPRATTAPIVLKP